MSAPRTETYEQAFARFRQEQRELDRTVMMAGETFEITYTPHQKVERVTEELTFRFKEDDWLFFKDQDGKGRICHKDDLHIVNPVQQ